MGPSLRSLDFRLTSALFGCVLLRVLGHFRNFFLSESPILRKSPAIFTFYNTLSVCDLASDA